MPTPVRDPAARRALRRGITTARYRYRTSPDAPHQAGSNTPTATSSGIPVAAASYNCAQEADPVGVRSAVETAHPKHQIALHAEEFAQAKQAMQQQLENATRILPGGRSVSTGHPDGVHTSDMEQLPPW